MDPFLCRICLSRTGTISVFSKEDDEIQYCTKITRLISVNVSENDGLPKLICNSCATELSACYKFVLKCEASDKALRCVSRTKDKCNSDDNDNGSDSYDYLDDELSSSKRTNKKKRNACKSQTVRKKRKRKPSGNTRNKLGLVQCIICGLIATSRSALETHLRVHTGEKPFQCEVCNRSFRTRGSHKRHVEAFHSKRERKFICETCGSSFYRKNDIIMHIRVHTDERPYVCQYCPKRFRQIGSIIRHRRTHTGEKPYSCSICGRKFADKNLVRKHQSVHSEEKNFQCHLCPKLMKSRTALNVHVNLHTKGKQNFCTTCGMGFKMKGNLNNHIRRVHSEKSGHCTVCSKNFPNLEVHMRKHTGEKPFVCEICDAAFTMKRCLAHHILFKHENSDKFKCSVGECTKTFPTATMLEFHLLKEHTNHTPYICQHCSKGFFRPSDLSRHLRVVHKDVPKSPLKSLTLKLEASQYT